MCVFPIARFGPTGNRYDLSDDNKTLVISSLAWPAAHRTKQKGRPHPECVMGRKDAARQNI